MQEMVSWLESAIIWLTEVRSYFYSILAMAQSHLKLALTEYVSYKVGYIPKEVINLLLALHNIGK